MVAGHSSGHTREVPLRVDEVPRWGVWLEPDPGAECPRGVPKPSECNCRLVVGLRVLVVGNTHDHVQPDHLGWLQPRCVVPVVDVELASSCGSRPRAGPCCGRIVDANCELARVLSPMPGAGQRARGLLGQRVRLLTRGPLKSGRGLVAVTDRWLHTGGTVSERPTLNQPDLPLAPSGPSGPARRPHPGQACCRCCS